MIAFMGLFQGCEWLELLPPDGLVVDEYWKTKEDVKATLMGAYQQFASMDDIMFYMGELRGDMLKPSPQAPINLQQVMKSNIYSTNSLCDWSGFYQIINYCNNVIEMAPKVMEIDNTFTEFNMKSYQAEAMFLRGLAYFYLVRIYGDVPYVDKPTSDDNVDFYIPKDSGDSILMWVEEDLVEYERTIATTYPSLLEDKGRATKGAMNALLADIALWRFDYAGVLRYIAKIEQMNKYFLLPTGKWFETYSEGNTLESIFEFQFDGKGQDNHMYALTYNGASRPFFSASLQAVEILDVKESKEVVRGLGSISIEQTGYRIHKYAGSSADRRTIRPSAEARACNWIVYRLSDILLMKAEALSQMDRFDEAEQLINKIRVRALMKTLSLPGSRGSFEDAILEERAKELAFEGKRYFDLMRMGRRNNYDRKNDFIEIIIQQAPSTQKLVLASKLSNPMGWYLPIYENELEKNAELEQNPYYDTTY